MRATSSARLGTVLGLGVLAGAMGAGRAAWASGCEAWNEVGNGVTASSISALIEFDGAIVAGGKFTNAGGTPANMVASWDGAAWTPLGAGLTSGTSKEVRALAIYNGELIAGGYFFSSGSTTVANIARWNGSEWLPLGSGMDDAVNALAVYHGDLYAAGYFMTAGGVNAKRIARWDGASWHDVAGGITFDNAAFNSTVSSMTVFDDMLYVGGKFATVGNGVGAGGLAKWNGSSWSGVGSPFGWIWSLGVHNGQLIAGGVTTAVNPVIKGVARRNGAAWEAIGAGVDGAVWSIATYKGDLIVGGSFTNSGSAQVIDIARWDGAAWSGLGNGLGGQVKALLVHDNKLNAGGAFEYAWGVPCKAIGRWADCTCSGDADFSGSVDIDDLFAVINGWGACPGLPAECPGDIAPSGGDGEANVDDLFAVINAWGDCP